MAPPGESDLTESPDTANQSQSAASHARRSSLPPSQTLSSLPVGVAQLLPQLAMVMIPPSDRVLPQYKTTPHCPSHEMHCGNLIRRKRLNPCHSCDILAPRYSPSQQTHCHSIRNPINTPLPIDQKPVSRATALTSAPLSPFWNRAEMSSSP